MKYRDSKVIDVIVPVYDGFKETVECLQSVSASFPRNSVGINLLVINDCSPNIELTRWLRQFCNSNDIQLVENKKNLGFVGTVNLGMAMNQGRDVVLLNSDTLVVNDWLDRLVRCAYKDSRIATVTPFSNNATICSFPRFCHENSLPNISLSDLDDIFSLENEGEYIDIPTGVGFCLFIKRESINEVGVFDEDNFGRGYGEENDFCMRVLKKGWRNIFCLDTFVAHVGGVSFSAEKKARVANAVEKMEKLHPGYQSYVYDHIAADPAASYRINAYIGMLSLMCLERVLIVSHNLGGGTDTHIEELIEYYEGQMAFFVLKKVEGREYSLSLGNGDSLRFLIPDSYSDFVNVLRNIGIGRVHFHHTMGIDPLLWNIADDLNVTMDFTVHDYYLINANPTLTDSQGRFCDDLVSRDRLCREHYELPFDVEIDVWREGARDFLKRCSRIIVPSQATADIFKEYYPEYDVLVAYHLDSELNKFIEPKGISIKGTLKVLVLGALSREKGADVLEAVARKSASRELPIEFHLLGYAYRPLHKSVIEHGPYSKKDVIKKLDSISPDIVWIPAQWPETYSYTLSEALEGGYPVFVPDIGAFPERVEGRSFSYVYPWNSNSENLLKRFLSIRGGEFVTEVNKDKSVPAFYRYDYVLKKECLSKKEYKSFSSKVDIENFLPKAVNSGSLSNKEKILVFLVSLRRTAFGRLIAPYLPVIFQRQVKRYLSRKPMHDLLLRR